MTLCEFTHNSGIGRPQLAHEESDHELDYAFQRAMVQQEHGIPEHSKHYRVLHKSFGELSLAIQYQGNSTN